MAETSYTVSGMTCEHCVQAVSGEIGALHGVHGVQVDLAAGRVTVTGEGFTDEQVRTAVDEAGYQVVDA